MDIRLRRSSPGLIAILLAAHAWAADQAAPITWLAATEIVAGRGERGPWRQNESRYDYVDDPSVAIAPDGELAVAWVDQARKDILFQRILPDGTRLPIQALNVSRSPATFSWLPRVFIAPGEPQSVMMVWQEIIFSGGSHGGEVFFARSRDGGASFSEPVNLSNSPGGDGKGRINRHIWDNGSLDLAAAGDGRLYAAWTEYDGALWFSRSTDGGASFSRAQRIDDANAKPARAPSLAADAGGTVYLAWTTGEDNATDIRVARSTDGGMTFDMPHIVAPSAGYSDAPRLALDSTGRLHLVYAESSRGPFASYQVRYTRSGDGARTFEAPREISRPAPESIESARFPELEIDSDGRLYVIWEAYRAHRERPRGLGLVVSCDGGSSFAPPSLVPGSMDPAGGTNGSHQGLLMKKLAANTDGVIAIVNSSLKEGDRSRVWLMRGQTTRRDGK